MNEQEKERSGSAGAMKRIRFWFGEQNGAIGNNAICHMNVNDILLFIRDGDYPTSSAIFFRLEKTTLNALYVTGFPFIRNR